MSSVIEPKSPRESKSALGAVGDKKEASGGAEPSVSYELNKDGTGTVQLAIGSVIDRYSPPLSHGPFDKQIFSSDTTPSDFHDLIPIMRSYYESDGLFGSVVDIMVQFSVDDSIENVTDDPEVEKFFDAVVETSNLLQSIRWAALEYHLLQNVFPYRTRTGRKTKARNGMKVPEYEWTVLNPEYTYVDGSLMFGDGVISIEPNDELVSWVNSPNFNPELLPLPSKVVNKIKKGGRIPLEHDAVYHIARNKQPFQRYSPVVFRRIIKPLRMKEKYMHMDAVTADGIINQIIIFKLGNDKHPVTSNEPLEAFAKLLQTPGKAYQLVWNHALEVDIIRSDPGALNPEKYGPINDEIMHGFAVPLSLLGDQNGGYGKDWIAVRSIIERLKWCREDLEAWIEREYRLIAKENGLKTWPKPKLGSIKLEEERAFKQILMNLYDRNIISAQTVLAETGFEYVTEIQRLKEEKDIREKEGILVPQSPYQQSKNGGGAPVISPGRPNDTPEDEPRDGRDPLPRPSGSGEGGKENSFDVPTTEHKLHVAMADSRFEEAAEELYLKNLEYMYESTRDKLLSAANVSDPTLRREEVMAILLAMKEEMQKVGEDALIDMFEYQYNLIGRSTFDEFEHNKALRSLLEWNLKYVDKLYFDLQRGVDLALEKESVRDIVFFIDAVFDKERYRLPHFAREGILRAKFVGASISHIEMGYGYGRWNCSFNNSCPECIDRHGRVYRVDDLPSMYPAHNRCRCWITFLSEVEGGMEEVSNFESSEANHGCNRPHEAECECTSECCDECKCECDRK